MGGAGKTFLVDSIKKELEKSGKTKKVIIVDDIERCSISPQNIFGFFSNFIVEQNIKVIFICNQEELLKKNTENNEYLRQKEKVIGMEFFVKPDLDSALNQFIRDYGIEGWKDWLESVIRTVCNVEKWDNLRTVQQFFFYISIVLNYLKDSESYIENIDVLKAFAENFFVLLIAKSRGGICKRYGCAENAFKISPSESAMLSRLDSACSSKNSVHIFL